MTEDMDTLRDELNETSGLAKLLFEQQFIRHGGRKPADPEWSDLDESERDEWWDRALDAGPLIEGERSSRQAWAEEALRLDHELEGRRRKIARALNLHHLASWAELQTAGTTYAEQWLDNIAAEINAEEVAKRAEPPSRVCACVSDDEATALVDADWSLPQCTVHPDGGAA